MPPLEDMDRTQVATYWEKTGTDDHGYATVAAKVNIDVRWENRSFDITAPNGSSVRIEAVVKVAQELVVGSVMWLGDKDAVPATNPKLMEVYSYEEVPCLKGRHTDSVVLLRRYTGTIPTATL